MIPVDTDTPTTAAQARPVSRHQGTEVSDRHDLLAVEEPLELRLKVRDGDVWLVHAVAVTMRTPGDDVALAYGFLYTENVVRDAAWVLDAGHPPDDQGKPMCNVVSVTLAPGVPFDAEKLSRHVFTSSSCGICGKQTIAAVRDAHGRPPAPYTPLPAGLPALLRERLEGAQSVFRQTGGLHASALFDAGGTLIAAAEDVGRHNALDKVIGALLRAGRLPADDTVLMLSGRASFELIQKAAAAGIPKVVAIGPPSTLAVDLARDYGMTLVGFLRGDRFNVYTGAVS